jgi:hypothetical protein
VAQNRVNSPRPIDQRENRPSGATKFQLTDARKVTPKQSRGRPEWFDSAKTLGPFINQTAKTAALAQQSTDIGVPVPVDAIGVILMVQVNNNTSTAGHVTFLCYADIKDSGGIGSGAVAAYGVPNVNASSSHRGTIIAPLASGKVCWETTTSGAVAYDLVVRLVGFIRA